MTNCKLLGSSGADGGARDECLTASQGKYATLTSQLVSRVMAVLFDGRWQLTSVRSIDSMRRPTIPSKARTMVAMGSSVSMESTTDERGAATTEVNGVEVSLS